MGSNIKKPRIEIEHRRLQNASPNSIFKKDCPVCDQGVLLVLRDEKYCIQPDDYCIYCGQHFYYTDLQNIGLG